MTTLSNQSSQFTSGDYNGPIILVFKGPACNAHFHNLVSFLESIDKLGLSHLFRVVFLDSPSTETPAICCKAFYLNNLPVSQRILSLKSIVSTTKCSCLIWVASVQNLGLFLFSRLAPVQAYWSMKYHSITCSHIDINFRSSTYADCISIENSSWYGIPSDFNSITHEICSKNDISASLHKSVPSNQGLISSLRLLTLGREIKINSPAFSSFISSVLDLNIYHYSYSGRTPAIWHKTDESSSNLPENVSFLGWLNIDQMYAALLDIDIYIDSFPFGGGHTCFYAMALHKPILMLNSDENKRCSYMMHLFDLRSYFGYTNESPESYGIFATQEDIIKFLAGLSLLPAEIVSSKLHDLASKQYSLFQKWSVGNHLDGQYQEVVNKMFSLAKS